VSVQWISERSDSRIGTLGDVIVKQHRPEADLVRTAGVRARHEYEVLTMLYAAMPAEYSVPRALSLDEAEGSLTLERATGTPLDVLIRDGKRQRNAIELLHDPVRRAGRWLREMQFNAGRASARPDGLKPVLRSHVLRSQVDLGMSDAQRVFTGRMQDRIVARLRELEGLVDGPVVGHHGDYWPGNVFIDTHRVQVIDFEGYRDGLPLEDVAYFLLQLQLLMPRHGKHLPHLREAFLEGYGGIDDHHALKLFTMTKTLRLMARNAGARHSFLLRIWMRRTLRNVVAGCLN
jgi:hypothetical protein